MIDLTELRRDAPPVPVPYRNGRPLTPRWGLWAEGEDLARAHNLKSPLVASDILMAALDLAEAEPNTTIFVRRADHAGRWLGFTYHDHADWTGHEVAACITSRDNLEPPPTRPWSRGEAYDYATHQARRLALSLGENPN